MITPVFPHTILPVRSGVYVTQQVDPEGDLPDGNWLYSWFDSTDRVWGCTASTPEDAAAKPDYEFAWQAKNWRGLTEESKS